ncbi:MAG: acyltransferase [Gordonia sp. (in: high G+C Gram-positive bacteria)]|uniref:acyltransferase n=1 Tax=Gordonia sp. (in: high G+C Gram-positive bacteria) TaxID=84139 RepID=UPI0039E5CB58
MTITAEDTRRAVPAPSGSGTATTASPQTTPKAKRPYLYQVDIIRSTTFALVIFIHCLTQTTDEFNNIGVNATSLLFHATRYIFFALTGYVLTYQYLDRDDFSAPQFWRRRMKLVIIPYIVWSAIYWMVLGMWSYGRFREIPSSLDELAERIGWGTAAFHLYFLLVMLQVYLLFPLLRLVVLKTRGHHLKLLGASLVLQVGIYWVISYWTPPSSWQGLWWHYYATFVPYQFFIVLGAVAAANREQVDDWIRGKGRTVAALFAATAAFAVGMYLYGAMVHGNVFSNASAFTLSLLPWLITAVVAIYAMGRHWAEHVRPYSPRFAKAAAYASNRSFPVFLVHVMVLTFLLRPKTDGDPTLLHYLPQPLGTSMVYVLTVAGSLALVEFLRRMPGSVYWTGRPRLPWRWQI